MRLGSLFSGAGGLDRAVEHVFGATVVWHCENDPAATKVLAHRWPGVPNLGDITEVDWAAVEPVDILAGGFPCTDISSAGRQAGMGAGTRSGLWTEYARAIAELRPGLVIIENVRNLLSIEANRETPDGAVCDLEYDADVLGDFNPDAVLRGLGAVLGDLADLGFDADWLCLPASAVGAPHRRERVFVLAYPDDTRRQGETHHSRSREPDARRGMRREPTGRREAQPVAADSDFERRQNEPQRHSQPHEPQLETPQRRNPNGRTDAPPDAACDGRHERRTQPTRLQRRPDAPLSGDGPVNLLPTPRSADGNGGGRYNRRQGQQDTLPGTVRLLPTPRSSDCFGAGLHGDGGMDLRTTVALLLPTPQTQPTTGNGHARNLGHEVKPAAWGKYEPAIRRWENITRPAPPPTEPNRNGNPRLNAAFSEWMMGWPAGWVTAVPGITRNDALKIVGNSVVTAQATAAIHWLLNVSEATA